MSSSVFHRGRRPFAAGSIALLAIFCLIGGMSVRATAAEGDLAIAGALIHTGEGPPIPDGVVLVESGRIRAVGRRAEVSIPQGVRVLPGEGRVVIPGLVEAWGEAPGDATGGQADLRAADLLDAPSRSFRRALEEGVTTLAIAPLPQKGVGGLGTVLKLRSLEPAGPQELILELDSHLVLALGLVAPNLGTPRIGTSDRLEQYYALRQRLISARDYRKAWDGYWEAVEKYNREMAKEIASAPAAPERSAAGEKAEDPPKADEKKPDEKKADEKKADDKKDEKKAEEKKRPRPPEKPKLDPQQEVLLRALSGKLPVLLLAHHRSDLGYAVRLKEEFGLDLSVVGASEGHRAAAELAAAKARTAAGPALLTRWSLDLLDHRESTPAEMAAAGVPVALSGLGGEAFPARGLRLSACVAARGGLPHQKALRAITAEPAAILGLADRVGTIAAGKDGDLVVLDGDPLSALSRVLQVIVEGRVVHSVESER